MSLLAKDNRCRTSSTSAPSGRLPLRHRRARDRGRAPAGRVAGETSRLIPLFTIGVFMGFTISQVGLVRHWRSMRPPRWRLRAAINGPARR